MTKTLMENFNELTDFMYDYIKLSFVNVAVRSRNIEVGLIYPEHKKAEVALHENKIKDCMKRALKSKANIDVKLVLSHFDPLFFKPKLYMFLKKYPILNAVTDNDFVFSEEDKVSAIKLYLNDNAFDYCRQKGIEKDIKEFLSINYCEKIAFAFALKKEQEAAGDSIDEFEQEADNTPSIVLDNPEGRFIRPANVEDFIGSIIYEPAKYIEDISKSEPSVVLCGTISNLEEKTSRPKENETEGKKYYKFVLADFTAQINCIYFPSKKYVDQITLLKSGKTVIMRGAAELDDFKKDGSYTYKIKDISFCTMPADFVINRIKKNVEAKYRCVTPEKYYDVAQSNLFDRVEKPVSEFLKNKTFCIFDLETTGLSALADRIIEIGAVKIENGKITETFSTYVDPGMPIPERITELTSITDLDVINAPKIGDALTDFYKFSSECIIIAHNLPFDYGFITAKGKDEKIYFDNERLDTIAIAKQTYPGLKKYSLDFLTKFFGIANKGAHRAIFDALATAELFILLSEKLS